MSHASQHTTGKILALTFVVALVLLGVFAAAAAASPDIPEICSDCHMSVGAAPTVQITSAEAVDPVTYSLHQSSTAWAAFDLSDNMKRLADSTSADGTFTAPLGHYVRVCSADGYATGTWTQAYIVTPKAPSHGTTSPSTPQVVAPGGSKAFSFAADSGYHLADVKVNNVSNPAAVTDGSYTFTNVQADGTIAATFAADVVKYTITPTAGANGTISPATPQSVDMGGSVTFTVTPNAGYQVDAFTVDGAAATLTAGKYTFTNVAADHSIAVTFKAGVQKCTATIALTGLKSGVLKLHKRVTIKGVVKPAHSGKATVKIQRKSGAKWRTAKTVTRTVSATRGAYSYSYKPTKTGTYRVKVSVAKASAYAAATTAYKTFKVKK